MNHAHPVSSSNGPAARWSEPGKVNQSVLDSNVLEQGSTGELRVAARDGGGSAVE
jgi:hypothetical protein